MTTHHKKFRFISARWDIFLVSLFLIGYSFLITKTASPYWESFRISELFGPDPAYTADSLLKNIQSGSLNFFYLYGHFFFNLSLFFYKLTQKALPHPESLALISQFIPTCLGSIGSLFFFYILIKRKFGVLAAGLGLCFLALTPEFFKLSIHNHPDTLQLMTLLIALNFLDLFLSHQRLNDLRLSYLFSGLSFSIKSAGFFLLPVIIFYHIKFAKKIILPDVKSELKRPGFFWAVAFSILYGVFYIYHWTQNPFEIFMLMMTSPVNGFAIICFGLFAWSGVMLKKYNLNKLPGNLFSEIIFFLVGIFYFSPYLLFNFSGWFQIYFSIVSTFTEGQTWNGFLWIYHLMTMNYLSFPLLIGFILSAVWLVKNNVEKNYFFITCLIFIITYFLFLFLKIKAYSFTHYLLPITPMIFLIFLWGVSLIPDRQKQTALLLVFLLVDLSLKTPQTMSWIKKPLPKKTSAYALATQLFKLKIPQNARILTGHYTYIPPSFTSVHFTYNLLSETLDQYDVLIIKKEVLNTFPAVPSVQNQALTKINNHFIIAFQNNFGTVYRKY